MVGKRVIKAETDKKVLSDYADGERASVVAKRYGINRKTVLLIVRRNGGNVRDQRSASGRPIVPPQSYVGKVLELRAQGLSQQKIGKELRMSQAVISRVLRQHGLPTETHVQGSSHGSWKGGRTISGEGYVLRMLDFDDPLAVMRNRSGYVLEHRLVIARAIGRPLQPRETIHHINGDKQDNRLENLQLRHSAHGTGVVFVCGDCGSRHIKPVALD